MKSSRREKKITRISVLGSVLAVPMKRERKRGGEIERRVRESERERKRERERDW
jgi:hypothetical protein